MAKKNPMLEMRQKQIKALTHCVSKEVRYVIACSEDCGRKITFDEWTATQLAEQAHYQGWSVGTNGFALCPECGGKDE